MDHSLFSNSSKNEPLHYVPVVYYFRDWEQFKMPIHSHPAIEIMYAKSGSCSIYVRSQKINLKKGEGILIDSQIPHRLEVIKEKCRMLNVEFIAKKAKGSFPSIMEMCQESENLNLFLSTPFEYKLVKNMEEMYVYFKKLVSEMDHRNNYVNVQLLLNQIIHLIADYDAENQKYFNLAHETTDTMRKIKEYISFNYDREINIKEIADHVHLNSSYIQRLFKKHENITIGKYILKLRLEKAAMMLKDMKLSVGDVCEYTGLNNRHYFYKVFKQQYGMSPSSFRTSLYNSNQRTIDAAQ